MNRIVKIFEERPVRFMLTVIGVVALTAAALSGTYSGLTSGLMLIMAGATALDIFFLD